MKISTKGRYALRVIVDLAEHSEGNYIAMKEVAERQNISLKYLEKILPALVRENIVEGVHGKGGGYKLTREPDKYTVGEILRLTEGELAPSACVECHDVQECSNKDACRTYPVWDKLNGLINNYLDSITIADLMQKTEIKEQLI